MLLMKHPAMKHPGAMARRNRLALAAIAFAALPLLATAPAHSAEPAPDPETSLDVALGDAVFGISRSLRARIAAPGQPLPLHLEWPGAPGTEVRYRWHPVLDTPGVGGEGRLGPGHVAPAPLQPGVYELELYDGPARHAFGDALRIIVTVPFDRKRDGRIGPYRMGRWPTEGKGRTDAYAPPAGFIEVTRANRDVRLSENFTVGQFLTKDQDDVWPKYLAIDPALIDKLELVMTELQAMGVRADHMVVMSGFRTPHYNTHHLGNAPTSLSRHQYGDAADVWIDNEGDWHMSDLNGDGHRDLGDARVMLDAVERVERRYPQLLGGAGLYRANRVRGPFIHIDVRGTRARW
jgi:uncharacterized protein YcbK (DUF882 family)